MIPSKTKSATNWNNERLMRVILTIGISLSFFGTLACSANKNSGDTVPPEIVAMTPDEGAENIPINTNVTITFSKPVAGINSDSVYINKLGVYGKLPATVNYESSSKMAIISPSENLAADSVYYVTVESSVRSEAGVPLKACSWTFMTSDDEDMTAPTISSKSPVDDRYIPVDGPIWLVFSEELNASTINDNTFYLELKNNDGTTVETVPATVSWIASANRAVLEPASDLLDWRLYTLKATDGIMDLAGNHFNGGAWDFRTNDTSAPKVVNQNPEDNATDVPRNSSISVTFSEPLTSSTIHNNSTNFKLQKNFGDYATISAAVIYNDTTLTATLIPGSELESNSEYKVILEGAVRDFANNTLDGGTQEWTFTTTNIEDDIPPVISSSTPANNATNVTPSGEIKLVFSENVTGADSTGIILERADNAQTISTTIIYSSLNKKATITPFTSLAEGTQYRIKLLSTIKDGALNSISPTTILFTTADETKPSITSHIPVSDAGAVSPNSTISIVFSEPVTGMTLTSVSIRNMDGGAAISGDLTYNEAGKILLFTPDGGFPENSDIEVTLSNSIHDNAGNTLDTYSFKFRTGNTPDTTPPAIVSPTYPDHTIHQTGIPRSSAISIYFNEPVTGIGAGTIQLKKGGLGGTNITCNVNYNAASFCATLDPLSPLDYSTSYTVVVKGGSTTDIKDAAGNRFAADQSWSFETLADSTDPKVTYRTPDSGTLDIPGNAVSVEVTFSEQVLNVNNSTFILRKNFGDLAQISCNVNYTYDPVNNVARAILTPLSDVTESGDYKIQLTTAITDLAASPNHLPLTEWTFQISALDTTNPMIVVRNPNSGATLYNDRISVVFSEDVKGVDGTSFILKDSNGVSIAASVSYSAGLLTAELVPNQALPYESTFSVQLSNAIHDRAGNPLANTNWNFKTPADTVPPSVTSIYPPAGTPAYAVNGQIIATFSEPIQNFNSTSFKLEPSAPGNIIYDQATNTLTLVPTSNLSGSTTYTVHVTTDITDKAAIANHMTTEYTWSFTTQSIPDETPPQIIAGSRIPGPDTTGVSQTTPISVQFSENITNASATTVKLKQGTQIVSSNIIYDSATYTVTIVPFEQLTQSSVYTIEILGGSTGIQDASGNRLSSTASWNFTTAADNIAPMIIAQSPVANKTGCQLKPSVTVTFNEPVTGVNSSSFYLTGTSLPVLYVVYDEQTRTAILTPGSNLAANTTYTVNLTSSIKDLAGNSLPTTWWQFTTNNEPYITNLYYSVDGTNFIEVDDNATGVPQNIQRLKIIFDRNMKPDKQWLEINEGTSTPSSLIPEDYFWSDSRTIIYSLSGNLKSATEYQIKLYGWGGSFEDTDGNTLSKNTKVGDGIWNLTAMADTTAPILSSSIPANSSASVGRNIGKLVLRFNEPMNTARSSSITISPTVTGFTMNRTWIEGNRTCVISIPQLAASTTYTISLNGGTSSFRDLAATTTSNNATGSFTFTTGTSTSSTTIYSENFEEYTAPNFSIFRNVVSDCIDCNWLRTSPSSEKAGNGTILTAAPDGGAYYSKGASWEWISGEYSDLETISPFNFSTPGTYLLSLAMFHERLFARADRLEIWISTNGSNFTRVPISSYPSLTRYDWSFGNDSPVWQEHIVDLSAYSGTGTVYVRLRAISAGETAGNVIIDNVKVTRY